MHDENIGWLKRLASSRGVRAAFVTMSLVAMISFGLVGIGRSGGLAESNFDMRYFHIAGRCWAAEQNPYNEESYAAMARALHNADTSIGFYYPPQMAPLCLLLAAFEMNGARGVMITLNLLSACMIAAICLLMAKQREKETGEKPASNLRWYVPAIVLGNPFTAHVLWMGQTSLLATAFLLSGWYFCSNKRWLVGGILMGAATFKPQLALLPFIWLVLERQWRVLLTASIATLILSLWPMIANSPAGAFKGWLDVVSMHGAHPGNLIGSKHLFGLRGFLLALGVPAPDLTPLAVGSVIALWIFHRRFLSTDILAIMLATQCLFSKAHHNYDLVVVTPLLVALWYHLREKAFASIMACSLMLAFFVPQRLAVKSNIDLLIHYRSVVLLVMTLWLIVLSTRAARKNEGGSGTCYATP